MRRRKMTFLLGASFPHASSGNPGEIRTVSPPDGLVDSLARPGGNTTLPSPAAGEGAHVNRVAAARSYLVEGCDDLNVLNI